MDFLLQYNLVLLKYIGEWTVAYPALYLTIALALALVLFIMIIVVAVRHSKNKKKIAALQAKANSAVDEAELRKQIRAELEAEYKNAAPAPAPAPAATDNAATQAQINELNDAVKQKQEQIDKLTAELEKANEKPDNGNLYRTINELN
ncbi:MAG: hypothetical protein K2M48_03060, partial [Clostridiales bacterium]|nr:hypothetical protein [Clostridiales bacterium]